MELSEQQLARYSHHIIHKDIGGEGQKKLLRSKVLIVGAGGLGSPAALYLAAAGVGTLGMADRDLVEASNLQRQIIHCTNDIGREKVSSAKKKLQAINPDVRVISYPKRITKENAESIIKDFDFTIDCSDNFPTKFLINDTCVKLGKPYSHAGIVGFRGQLFTHIPGSICYRCIFPESPPNDCIQDCRGSGILGATAGIVGSMQASEAIKFILNKGELLTDKILTADLMTMTFRTVPIKRNAKCPTCGDKHDPVSKYS